MLDKVASMGGLSNNPYKNTLLYYTFHVKSASQLCMLNNFQSFVKTLQGWEDRVYQSYFSAEETKSFI